MWLAKRDWQERLLGANNSNDIKGHVLRYLHREFGGTVHRPDGRAAIRVRATKSLRVCQRTRSDRQLQYMPIASMVQNPFLSALSEKSIDVKSTMKPNLNRAWTAFGTCQLCLKVRHVIGTAGNDAQAD